MKLVRHAPAGRPVPRAALANVPGSRPALANGPAPVSVWPDVHVSLFDSGTAALAVALQLALQACAPSKANASGSARIAVPAYGCPNLVAAVLWAGGTPVYYDISPETLGPAGGSLAALAADLVVHVDAFGAETLSIVTASGVSSSRIVHDLAQSFAPYAPGWRSQMPCSVLSLGRAKPASLTFGGALLASREVWQTLPALAAEPPQAAPARWKFALRARLYSWSLRPQVFGLLARIPALGIGQTKFAPLEGVRRLPDPWICTVRAVVDSVQGCLEALRRDSVAMLDLARSCGAQVPHTVSRTADRLPLWRVPVLCRSPELASRVAEQGAHLGISRLYGRALPEFLDASPAEAAERWPGAVSLAGRLITLPTHGRLERRAQEELRQLLQGISE